MTLTERLSLRELDQPVNLQKKNDFLLAFKLIKELPPSNPNSFWSIATFHGMPFKQRVAPPTNPDDPEYYWNGYCQHGNVLFPTWHRFFCLRMEQALQTVVPGRNVALHYWDQTSDQSLEFGIPSILVDDEVVIDGETVPNPLLNFQLPKPIADTMPADSVHRYYVKPIAGYTTKRYPYSGIIYPPAAEARAALHNASIDEMTETPTALLQENVLHWLNVGRTPGTPVNSVYDEYVQCRDTPNYNAFSNVTSASSGSVTVPTLEQPHNDVHLMVGGFTQPDLMPDGSVKVDSDGGIVYFGLIKGANGDMGCNEMSAFDPLFFLHHANIDRMFWVWQKKWQKTFHFDIFVEPGPESGTSTKTSTQGPSPNQGLTQTLGLDTLLHPFEDELGVTRTTRDCMNITTQLGYTYSIGSLDQENWPAPPLEEERFVQLKMKGWNELTEKLKEALAHQKVQVAAPFTTRAFIDITDFSRNRGIVPFVVPILGGGGGPGTMSIVGLQWRTKFHLKVENINLNSIVGSFVVQVYYKKNGKLYYLGQKGVLSRWDRKPCDNCQERNNGSVGFIASDVWEIVSDPTNLHVLIVSKDPLKGTLNTIRVDATKEAGDDNNPRVRYVTSLEQVA